MGEGDWDSVDLYFADRLAADPKMAAVLAANAEAGLPAIDVSPLQGKFIHLIARAIGARRVLEIGTLGGYSTIWLARAVGADGEVVTVEHELAHARTARANVVRAGLADRVDIRVGAALELLPRIEAERRGPFDLVFIDADKANQDLYLAWGVRLSRPGTVIIGDNVVREGEVIDAESENPAVQGIRRFIDLLANEPRLSATAVQTVGSKGWDGFAFAVVD